MRSSEWFRRACKLPARHVELIERGHRDGRSPDMVIVPAYPNFFGSFAVTTHSGPWRYLQKVPLVFYGPGFVRRRGAVDLDREVTLADLAPTLAELLDASWPDDRPGLPITDALVPRRARRDPPKMILVVVWDGGGWNVLRQWPQRWPFLAKMMGAGTSVRNVGVGSSPSVTPAVHTTLGTGVWPRRHGIVDLHQRRPDGGIAGPFQNDTPDQVLVTTLADIYDITTENSAEIGMLAERTWHIGMVGHGAYINGGDKDIVALGDGAGQRMHTNEEWYSLPGYLDDVPGLDEDIRTVDREDGRVDGSWMGDEVLDDPDELPRSPVHTLYQTRQLKALFSREGFGRDEVTDLFYTNYKQLDLAGHFYNMVNPEVGSSVAYADDALRELAAYLDRTVGANEWVMVMTADHGQGPDPISFGAWPIDMDELVKDVSDHLEVSDEDLFDKSRISGFWVNAERMEARGISTDELAGFLNDYRLRSNVVAGQRVPARYRSRLGEKLFAAAFPSEHLGTIAQCIDAA